MTQHIGIVMDPIAEIKVYKDTSFALMLEAQQRGFVLYYMEQNDLFLENGNPYARTQRITLKDDRQSWFTLRDPQVIPLSQLDIILMRKDPPVDQQYLYTTQILEKAQTKKTRVSNNPRSLRDFNEKLITSYFPEYCPPSLVTANANQIKAFLKKQKDIILKPLHGFGGYAVFRVKEDHLNINVIIETLTHYGRDKIMVQRFIPEIKEGDKRFFIIDGETFPYGLARIPQGEDTRGNLAAGGKGTPYELSEHDRKICKGVGKFLKQHQIHFAGIDIIGNYLTEINITCPTCVREVDHFFKTNVSALFWDTLLQSNKSN